MTKKERAELKKLTRRIRTQKATLREVNRAIDLTNKDHAEVRNEPIKKMSTSYRDTCMPWIEDKHFEY